MAVRTGQQSVMFPAPPAVLGWASVVGTMEGAGPLGDSFGRVEADDRFGQSSWEQAESAMQREVIAAALHRAGLHSAELDCLFAGDLLDQCIGSSFAARAVGVPYLGLYAACAAMGAGLIQAAAALEAGFARVCAVAASSHFCSAERQYRTPLEYGGQRPPSAQWTVTGAGAVVLGHGPGVHLTHATLGRVVDQGITDPASMGAAMAPVDVKLAPYPEETGQYEIQLFSTRLVVCSGVIGSQIDHDKIFAAPSAPAAPGQERKRYGGRSNLTDTPQSPTAASSDKKAPRRCAFAQSPGSFYSDGSGNQMTGVLFSQTLTRRTQAFAIS